MSGVSAEEMDRRIALLAKRAGIGGQVTVRHVTPEAAPSERAAAAAKVEVLEVMRNGRPSTVGYLAHVTGLTRPTVTTVLRALADAGQVVQAGSKIEAKGRRQRLWMLAETA